MSHYAVDVESMSNVAVLSDKYQDDLNSSESADPSICSHVDFTLLVEFCMSVL